MSDKWYEPDTVRQVADCLENLAAITAFLQDFTTQNPPGKTIEFSEPGEHGLYLVLSFLEDCLHRANEVLLN